MRDLYRRRQKAIAGAATLHGTPSYASPAGTPGGEYLNRMHALAVRSAETHNRVAEFSELATRGLPNMYEGTGVFVHTMRGQSRNGDQWPRGEGDNLRYAAIVALGLAHMPLHTQRKILRGSTAADLAAISMNRAAESQDAGAVALSAWAGAEVAGLDPTRLLDMLTPFLALNHPVETVICSWALCAALATEATGRQTRLVSAASTRLIDAQTRSGLFPHVLPQHSQAWSRAHVGCFADQVYPIQALARLSSAEGDYSALDAAEKCADAICRLQGPAGQWWWHYDVDNGSIVEEYPVYSVHQHAMGPMALLELFEAGGGDRFKHIIDGVQWLDRHPESRRPLVSDRHALIWRKIGRREPRKAVRSISALTTRLKPGWRLPGLDAAFPPDRLDHECRPYEFGWMLYAWHGGGVVRALHQPRSMLNG